MIRTVYVLCYFPVLNEVFLNVSETLSSKFSHDCSGVVIWQRLTSVLWGFIEIM